MITMRTVVRQWRRYRKVTTNKLLLWTLLITRFSVSGLFWFLSSRRNSSPCGDCASVRQQVCPSLVYAGSAIGLLLILPWWATFENTRCFYLLRQQQECFCLKAISLPLWVRSTASGWGAFPPSNGTAAFGMVPYVSIRALVCGDGVT
jgi:hypothetical protein